jgi:hypothetical protein
MIQNRQNRKEWQFLRPLTLWERSRGETPAVRSSGADAHLFCLPLDHQRYWSLVYPAERAVACRPD